MRRLLRVCRRVQADRGILAMPAILVAGTTMLLVDFWSPSGWAMTVRPAAHLFQVWMLLLLLSSHLVWTVLRVRGLVDPAAGAGFVLSAFGLLAGYFCHYLVYGLSETYGSHSVLEDMADDRLRFLIAAHRWGGPTAVFVGLALVASGSRSRLDRPRF